VRIAYFDAFSGISGDMTVGAWMDLGLPIERLHETVRVLGLDGVTLASERVERSGIGAIKFHVRVHGEHPDPPGGRGHHDHHGTPGAHAGPAQQARHGHRRYADIRRQLAASALDLDVRERALAIFEALAEAEARVHGTTVDDVAFHEVGAADAMIDIVGAALGFVYFRLDDVYVSPLPLGDGLVRAAHGPLPVPGPATLELLRGWPVRLGDGRSELVTPTGAAIVAGLARRSPLPPMVMQAVGYGAGDRVLDDRPNLLRVVLGEPALETSRDEVVVLEATIDDMSPQLYEHVLERLLAAGARDAFLAPVVMKKSRPGTTLRVLAAPEDRDRLAAIVFAETSTIGLRYATWQRLVLRREERVVETEYGAVRVKLAHAPDGTVNVAPEFDDCRRLAVERGVPLKLVHRAALLAASTAR